VVPISISLIEGCC